MIRTINSHDIEAGIANIAFEHSGVTILAQDYALINLIPGTQYVLTSMGLTFDEEYQLRAIDYLEQMLTAQIDSGAIQPPPPSETPAYEAPPEPSEPEAE